MNANRDPLERRSPSHRIVLILKIAGTIAAGWPVAVLVLFTLAEGFPGDILPAVPLLLLLIAAWRWPFVVGAWIVSIGTLIAIGYPTWAHGPAEMIVSTEILLMVPPIVGGLLFLIAGWSDRRAARHA